MKKRIIHPTQNQGGQALLEFAILGSLLISIFLAVGYIGFAVTTQQRLHVAARFAAREMSKESTTRSNHRATGGYITQRATKERFEQLALQNLNGQINPLWLSSLAKAKFNQTLVEINRFLGENSKFQSVNTTSWLYTHSETIPHINQLVSPAPTDINGDSPNSLTNLHFGVGALYFGNSLTYRLNAMAPIARYFGIKNMVIKATSLMPAELPLRGSTGTAEYGLLALNPWIARIVQEDINSYPDLIELE